MNSLHIIGNLTREPETATTQNGKDYTKFTVAVSRKFKDQNGNKVADFFNCIAWGKLGTDVISKYCVKGSKVGLRGRIESQTKEVETDKKIVYWNVTVEDIELLSSKTDTSNCFENSKPIDEDLPF